MLMDKEAFTAMKSRIDRKSGSSICLAIVNESKNQEKSLKDLVCFRGIRVNFTND